MYLVPESEGKNKADVIWKEGIHLGMISRSEEYYIGTEEGVIKVRTIRRYGLKEQQWDVEKMKKMQGTPWEPVPGREGI